MAYYKHRTEGKTTAKFAEAKQHKLEGTVELAPNADYKAQNVYSFRGLGSVFNGDYKFQKVTKRIDTTGFTVSADVVQIKSGGSDEVKNTPATPEKKVEKAETKTKANKEYVVKKGDTLMEIARKETGSASNWKAIEEANRGLITSKDSRNKTQTGHWIYPNQKLTIPGSILK